MTRVFRIQDGAGRGPWRPGFSQIWCDEEFAPGMEALPPYYEEFGRDLIERRGLPGEHYGCAVRKLKDLARWVSPTECKKLAQYGYHPVSLKPDRILAESKNQLVFACRTPLARANIIILPWESVAAIERQAGAA